MSSQEQIEDSRAPLIEHLIELRLRLIYSLTVFLVCMVVSFSFWNPIFKFLTQPLCSAMAERGHTDCGLILIRLQEGFFVAVSISLACGLMLSFPYIAYQMWRFVAPGLYKKEKGAFLPFLIASPFMFLVGAAFAFFVVTPLAFEFFLGFQQPGTAIEGNAPVGNGVVGLTFLGSADAYLSLTIKFIVAFGLCFQLPVLLTLLGKAELISAEGLVGVRKYAVVGILIVAALATPPDVVTQIILFLAIYPLYEVSIFLIRRIETAREIRLRADGYYDY